MKRSAIIFVLMILLSTLFLQAEKRAALARQSKPIFYQDLSWSPDGKKLCFSSNREGNFELYVMRMDDGHVTRLTSDAASDRYGVWSPDGKRIAFASSRDGHDEIYLMNADGSQPARLTTGSARNSFPSWSRDGKRIAFMSQRDGNWQVYVMRADGSQPSRVTQNAANNMNPMFSPDGKKIVFESDRDGRGKDQIFVINPDGKNETRLTNNGANNVFPAWSPDGKQIIFGSNNGSSSNELWTMKADGSAPNKLTAQLAAFFGRWSPKSQHIAFIAGNYPATEIYSMTARSLEQKRLTGSI